MNNQMPMFYIHCGGNAKQRRKFIRKFKRENPHCDVRQMCAGEWKVKVIING